MNQITFKSVLMRIVAVLLFTLGTISASAQYYMNVVQKDGKIVQFLVPDIDNVFFSGKEGPTTKYEYVDLGLSVKWATCNVGATKPEEYGDYFEWGETEPYYEAGYAQESPQAHWKDGKTSGYTWTNYKFRTSGDSWSNVKFSKYNTSSSYGPIDNNTTLDLEDDVAHVQWGGTWRMPTKAEQDDLRSKCTWTWYSSGNTEFNGVAGYKVTSKIEGYADRFIFLPAAGCRNVTGLNNVGSYGNYWSSSLSTDGPSRAWHIHFGSSGVGTWDDGREAGFSVRPVCPKEMPNDPTPTNIITSVTLDSTSLSLKVSGKYTLKAMAWSGDEEVDTATITWRSDNESVATVSAEGLVTAVVAGTATITATYQDKTASCVVTVSAASSQEEIQYEYVDLGLSVKWATCNVGATKPEEYGDYFAWGETEPKTDYSCSTYKWCKGSYTTMIKYCNKSDYGNNGFTDTKTTLDPEDDVAYVQWGGTWRMPTKAEQDDLRNKCTWTWYSRGNTEFNGVAGYKVTSKIEGYTDRSIFLPAAGSRYDNGLNTVGSLGYYWSSSLYTVDPYGAWYIQLSSSYVYASSLSRYRSSGLSVRPVCP